MTKVLDYWERDEYYKVSEEASRNKTHPAVVAIKGYAKISKNILDMGCGDGTRLASLETQGERVGVDISDFAINKGRKKFKNINLVKGDISNLPFDKESFDFIYSMFVIEHIDNPERVIKEAFRLLKKGGVFVLAAPNYGAPNRRSPNSREGRLSKLFGGFKGNKRNGLGWVKVEPKGTEYFVDADTQVEPYIGSLLEYMKSLGFKIKRASALWGLDEFSLKQVPFKILGILGIKPFVWWGPQIFIIAKKGNRF